MAEYQSILTNPNAVLRTADNAIIPADPANRDYQAFLAWMAAGGRPADAVPVPEDAATFIARSAAARHASRVRTLARRGRTADALQLILQGQPAP